MFQLAVRSRQLAERPVFPERLEENGPRQGFFEHAEYTAVREHLPAPYQDVLDFAYYSGWRKREILDLRWDEVDESGWEDTSVLARFEVGHSPVWTSEIEWRPRPFLTEQAVGEESRQEEIALPPLRLQ